MRLTFALHSSIAVGLIALAIGTTPGQALGAENLAGDEPSESGLKSERQTSDRSVEARIRSYLAPLGEMRDFSGVVLVSRKGESPVIVNEGLASYELGVRIDPAFRFGIGSISKTFTAFAIVLLAREGRLSLDDRVSKFLPGLPYGDDITIAQLLRHEAGVPDYYTWPEYIEHRTQAISVPEFVALIGKHQLEFEPGSRSAYSNSGYALLAAVIEAASGSRYGELLQSRILAPLQLDGTDDMSHGGIVKELANGYDAGFAPENLQPPVRVHPSWLVGSGSIVSTAGDLHRWALALQNNEKFRLADLPYPFGWGERSVEGRALWEQNGRIPLGYASYLGIFPEDGTVVIALSNVQVNVTPSMGRDLAALAHEEEYTVPTVRPRARIEASHLKELAGVYDVAPGFSLMVRAEGERLALAGPEGDFLPLDALDGEHFFFRPLYVTVTFTRDESGRIIELDWDGAFTARRKQ